MKTFLVAALCATLLSPALAQDYPSRPVHLVVPVSAGTVMDLLARTLSGPMSRALGQPVVVENEPGTGGVTATNRVVRSPRDGYTIAITSNNHVVNPSIYKNLPYDSLKDIAPLGFVGSTPLVLVANPSLAATDARSLIALAKSRPGQLNYGSSGNGTVLQLAAVLFNSQAGTDIRHVPYKSFANMLTDVMSGQVQIAFSGLASVVGQVKAGRLRAIGLSTPARSAALPDVPTLAESGLPDYSFDAWFILFGPSGLPRPVVDRIHAALKTALGEKAVQEVFATNGVSMAGGSPEQAASLVQSELTKHEMLVKRSGATQE